MMTVDNPTAITTALPVAASRWSAFMFAGGSPAPEVTVVKV